MKPPRGVPEICGAIIRVRLDSGDVYEFSIWGVLDVVAMVDCCGGVPMAMLRMTSGREYRLDHDFKTIKALLDVWHAGRGPSSA